jgi:hypothetical protein
LQCSFLVTDAGLAHLRGFREATGSGEAGSGEKVAMDGVNLARSFINPDVLRQAGYLLGRVASRKGQQ